jgi:predicted phage tail protein
MATAAVLQKNNYKIYINDVYNSYYDQSSVPAFPFAITGLTNGTSYAFAVAATNANGTGSSSSSVSVTPSTVPGAPTNVTATAGNALANISWTAPANNGGSQITGYVVTSVPSDGIITINGTSATVTGLTNGTIYTFYVAAININGDGEPSSSNSIKF